MAVPTITLVQPSSGPAGGSQAVKITGTNFALVQDPPDDEFWTPSVQVIIDDRQCEFVRPEGADLIWFITPKFRGTAADSTPVDVTIKNLDANGDPIPDEEVTKQNGFTYLRASVMQDRILSWILRELMDTFERQLMSRIAISADEDHDPEPGTPFVELSELPVLILSPRTENEEILPPVVRPDGDERFKESGGKRLDFHVELHYVDEDDLRTKAVGEELRQFTVRNAKFEIPSEVGNSSSDLIELKMRLVSPPEFPSQVSGERSALFTLDAELKFSGVKLSSFDAGQRIAMHGRDFHGYKVEEFVIESSQLSEG